MNNPGKTYPQAKAISEAYREAAHHLNTSAWSDDPIAREQGHQIVRQFLKIAETWANKAEALRAEDERVARRRVGYLRWSHYSYLNWGAEQ